MVIDVRADMEGIGIVERGTRGRQNRYIEWRGRCSVNRSPPDSGVLQLALVSNQSLSISMQTLWLARHANRQDFANPDWATTADRPHDPGLSPDGVQQAKQLGRRVGSLGIDRIVSSPYLRSVETAHHVASATDLPIVLEPGLGEWLNDDWFEAAPNTLAPSTLAARFEHLVPQQSDEPCRQPNYPESKHRALARLGAAGHCLVDRYAGETLLLVGHGITVQGVLHGLVDEEVPTPGCPLASLTKVVEREKEWTIARRNDTSHLENGSHAADRLV